MTHESTTAEPAQIDLPAHLRERIQRRIEGTEFDSVEEYATFALEQLLVQIDRTRDDESAEPPRETDGLEERLESLGYL